MIELSITQSPDSEIAGNLFSFWKNVLWVGRNQGDLLLNDPEVFERHVRFELDQKGFCCYKRTNIDFLLINGKKSTAAAQFLQIGDRLTLGKTTLLLQNFLYVPALSKSEIIQKNLTEIYSSDAHQSPKTLLDLLEKDLRSLK